MRGHGIGHVEEAEARAERIDDA
ncbi:hypothetical protein TNCV_4240681, partial [Trichonephila clavipes]